jgi:hypothetical protein
MFRVAGRGKEFRQDRAVTVDRAEGRERSMDFILWIIAVILVIAGIVTLIRGGILWGIVLIIVGLLVGPGGVSIFT